MNDELNLTRLDKYLVSAGLVKSRAGASESISRGEVTVNGVVSLKASMPVSAGDKVECHAPVPKYVSRGGYKLEGAIAAFGLDVSGKICLDIGASTGGFTDCLLQHGASRVYAIDVGNGQLDRSLLNDPRVVSMENTDIRKITPEALPERIDTAVMDLSFISLKKVFPALKTLLSKEAAIVCLIKPQFEAGRTDVGKGGIVKQPRVHVRVLTELMQFFVELGFYVLGLELSPISGGDGNIEYLCFGNFIGAPAPLFEGDLTSLVKKALGKQ